MANNLQQLARTVAILADSARAIEALGAAGVPVLAIKGVALTGWLVAPGARAMLDGDLLVERGRRRQIMEILAAQGFVPIRAGHSPTARWAVPTLNWLGPHGTSVDVHLGLGAWPRFVVDVAGILARSRPHPALTPAARRPHVDDMLVLLALDAAKDDGREKSTRAADLQLLAGQAPDWQRVVDLALQAGVGGALWRLLERAKLLADLPVTARQRLQPSPWRRAALTRALPAAPLPAGSRWTRPALRRLIAGAALTDAPHRYGAAVAFFAARSVVDRTWLATQRALVRDG